MHGLHLHNEEVSMSKKRSVHFNKNKHLKKEIATLIEYLPLAMTYSILVFQ